MEESAQTLLLRLFRDMPDPRMIGKVSHKLHDILVITVLGVISGLEHWTQIEDFGKANEAWFRTFLDLPNGIPSHDTFGKVLATLARLSLFDSKTFVSPYFTVPRWQRSALHLQGSFVIDSWRGLAGQA